ncbi:Riboflavin biosynthesis protein RibD [Candidatus Hodgkinia cicadicola]|uniref:Riboflavin biosynthesis protein RibD n=1 Tax=Candidatus Hodgkinia cicadicola TaxID=573658 RepID=A0ABX4MF39_9HYPH|nr:Riboflavin biosynthesis protein RibD [Candidatus Hodgkinia cicadicola]PIM96722.1 Riboflavin biosynthesis protein RibD [Candidatus Hodgkinia cicadicola]
MNHSHFVSILKYLIGSNLKRFVYNENNYPIVECYAIIGQWIIRTDTAQGGHPHAEILCLSTIHREKPSEIILSLSPCLEFDKTPPCCYSLLSICSDLLILELNKNHVEIIRFMRCFVNIGWMQPKSLSLITSFGSKIVSDIELRVANLNRKLSVCNVYPILIRQHTSCITTSKNIISIDKCKLNNRTECFGNITVRQVISQENSMSCDLILNSNYYQVWINNIYQNNMVSKTVIPSLDSNSNHPKVTKQLMRLTCNSYQQNDKLFPSSMVMEVGSLFSRINSTWPCLRGIKAGIVISYDIYNDIFNNHLPYANRCWYSKNRVTYC